MRAQITTSALMSCEPSTQAHVVIHARMSDLLWAQGPKNNKELYIVTIVTSSQSSTPNSLAKQIEIENGEWYHLQHFCFISNIYYESFYCAEHQPNEEVEAAVQGNDMDTLDRTSEQVDIKHSYWQLYNMKCKAANTQVPIIILTNNQANIIN